MSTSAAELPTPATQVHETASWSRLNDRTRPLLAAAIVFVPALLLYMRTLMPDVNYWDTAEFQALGPVLGIAHPTGYPSYTLLLWLASVVLQPFGNPAFRADMLSALLVAGACALLGATVSMLTRRLVVGIGVGIAFAVASRVWAIGLHADPHAFHLFLIALLLLLLVVWADRHKAGRPKADWALIAAAVVFGVSLGNHALTLLLAPGVGLYVLLVYPGILRRLRLVATCVGALVLTTVALYAYLPIRSAMNPPLDYANPQTWESFKYVVFGEQFTGTFHARPSLKDSVNLIASESWTQLGLLLPLAALGIVVGFVRRAALMIMLIAWFVVTWYFDLGYENADIGRYYLVPLMCVAVVGGLGAGAILEGAKVVMQRLAPAWRPYARAAFAVIMAVVLIVPAVATVPGRFHAIDESTDLGSRAWLDSLATALPEDALIVSWWSYSTPLWYAQYVEGWRPDVTIIDDRTILDQHLGSAEQVVADNVGQRPVFLIRLPQDYAPFQEQVRLAAAARRPGPAAARGRGPQDDRVALRDGRSGTRTAEPIIPAVADAAVLTADRPPADAPSRVPALSFFFPAHNEEANIEALVAEALEVLPSFADEFEIIAVDDGSRDATLQIANRLAASDARVRVVHHETNMGYGAAVRSGLKAARYELVAFTDGDRQFKVADLGRLLERMARSDKTDVVAGYRLKRADPFIRTAYARAYRLALNIFYRLGVRDVDCAFKLFKRSALEGIRLESGGAFMSAELLIKLKQRGRHIAEVGVPHYPRTAGSPTGAKPSVIFRAVRDFWRLRVRLWINRAGALERGEPVVS